MSRSLRSDWVAYWARYSNLNELENKSFQLDDTLREIEAEVGCKLMSGDQMQIIMALEDRIRELAKTGQRSAASAQINLFD